MPPRLRNRKFGRHVVGDEDIDPSIAVQVGRDDAQAPPVGIDDAGLGGHVHEPAAVVAEQVVRQRPEVSEGYSRRKSFGASS